MRLRVQFRITQVVTRLLRVFGWREPAIRLLSATRRTLRGAFERFGSSRYSRPALHGMDTKLDRIIDRNDGFFVEAGSHDGFTQSNTYYLERFRNWSGVLVEPMRELAEEARRNRPHARVFNCALVPFDHPDPDVVMHFGDLFSNVDRDHLAEASWAANGLVLGWRDPRQERVPARPLSTVLDDAGADRIDLLSLDVEGYEAEVLRGLDFSRHAPTWILIEMHDLAAGRARIGAVLGEGYVEHSQLSPLDVLYRRADGPAPRAPAAAP